MGGWCGVGGGVEGGVTNATEGKKKEGWMDG